MPDNDDRDDLYQEIVINIWKNRDKFEGRSQISTWIYKIAVNTSLLHIRSSGKRENLHTEINENIHNIPEDNDKEEKIKTGSMIEKLYEASNAGVQIRMIIRSVCSLVTEVLDLSENIKAISIVDKYLEHSRIFVFCNAGDEKYYISSADWMLRNFDLRTEVAVPIFDKHLQKELRQFLEIQWSDNTKARILNREQDNSYKTDDSKTRVRAQDDVYKYLKHQSGLG